MSLFYHERPHQSQRRHALRAVRPLPVAGIASGDSSPSPLGGDIVEKCHWLQAQSRVFGFSSAFPDDGAIDASTILAPRTPLAKLRCIVCAPMPAICTIGPATKLLPITTE
uniref:Uncharacterized protein n=1 Tax=Mycena chlorophos TaxID=658473 RepID=A0ABQ0LPX2_MYCCL|nr:predicted protein [Mycena chlorophos]